jgi:hypothetical protein
MKLSLEICRGVAGDAVYLANHRIAGPRHNGLMTTVHSWQVEVADMVEALDPAIAIETEGQDREDGLGAKHESAVGEADASKE